MYELIFYEDRRGKRSGYSDDMYTLWNQFTQITSEGCSNSRGTRWNVKKVGSVNEEQKIQYFYYILVFGWSGCFVVSYNS